MKLEEVIRWMKNCINMPIGPDTCILCPYQESKEQCVNNLCSEALKYLEEYKYRIDREIAEATENIERLKFEINQIEQRQRMYQNFDMPEESK